MIRALWLILLAVPTFGAGQYTLDLYGGSTVYQGYDLWVRVGIHYTGTIEHVWVEGTDLVSITGVPATMFADTICMNGNIERPGCWAGAGGRRYFYNTTTNPIALNIHIRTRTSTPTGTYTLTLHTESYVTPGEVTIDIPVTVAAAPTVPVKNPVPSPQAIPNLLSWSDTMTTLGDKWCKHQTVCSEEERTARSRPAVKRRCGTMTARGFTSRSAITPGTTLRGIRAPIISRTSTTLTLPTRIISRRVGKRSRKDRQWHICKTRRCEVQGWRQRACHQGHLCG